MGASRCRQRHPGTDIAFWMCRIGSNRCRQGIRRCRRGWFRRHPNQSGPAFHLVRRAHDDFYEGVCPARRSGKLGRSAVCSARDPTHGPLHSSQPMASVHAIEDVSRNSDRAFLWYGRTLRLVRPSSIWKM